MSVLVQHFLRRSVRLFPDTVAVDDGTNQVSYRQLEQRVDQCCIRLGQEGIHAGQRIAIFGNNSVDYVATIFACAHLGIVLVPMNAHLQTSEIEWILNDCDPVAIIADAEYTGGLEQGCHQSVINRLRFVIGKPVQDWRFLFDSKVGASLDPGVRAAMVPEAIATPQSMLIQMYTSGTTGTPKGVMLSHENMTSVVTAWLHEMRLESEKSCFMQATPLFHVGGLLMCLSTIATGASLVVLPRFNPQLALDTLIEKRITHALLVPSMIQQVLLISGIEAFAFPHLDLMVYGASCMPQAVLQRAIDVFSCQFLQGYGLTETAGVALSLRPKDHTLTSGQAPAKRLRAAGRELLCCEVRVVDSDNNDVEVGIVGEIIVRGANVTAGYWNNPQATAEAIVDGWLKTGDLATRDKDGYIYVVDRLKDMIDVGGENVYPVEVENVLSGHPDVAEVAVIGLPNVLIGEEVVAVVVVKDGEKNEPQNLKRITQELKAYSRQYLAPFKCPVRTKYLQALPRTPAGKIQKQELRNLYIAKSSQ